MDNFLGSLVTVATAVVGLAIVAVLVSKQANTSALVQNSAVGFSQVLEAAVSPLSSGFAGGGVASYANTY